MRKKSEVSAIVSALLQGVITQRVAVRKLERLITGPSHGIRMPPRTPMDAIVQGTPMDPEEESGRADEPHGYEGILALRKAIENASDEDIARLESGL